MPQRPEQLPSGRWRGVARDRVSGKRTSKTFPTFAEANAWAITTEAEIDGGYRGHGLTVTRQQRGIPSFAEHVVAWARKGPPDCELATLRNYRSQARMLAARWPAVRVDDLTEDAVTDYLAELRDDAVAPSTRTLRLTVLRHAMRAAVKAGYRADDPTLGIKGPKAREHQGRVLAEPELMLMLACLPGWLWPAALLSHDAGPRIGEIAGLRMFNLNLLHGLVTIADVIDDDGSLRTYPKGKVIRDVPLSARALAALREHVRCHPPAGPLAPVFALRGEHPPQLQIRRAWNRALKLAQLPGIKPTWHDLRHSCATTLADSGADAFVIKEVLGHRSVATSQKYVRKASLARRAAAIQGAFGGSEDASMQVNSSALRS